MTGIKIISVPLREFAVPCPRTGSIEACSGYRDAAAEGREIHSRIQRKRTKSDPAYEPEVPVNCSFDRGGYRFVIEGRMDGVFRHEVPRIEEIKTSFAVFELRKRLLERSLEHPYCLQLLTYGYFYKMKHGIAPVLSFHLASTRNRDSVDLGIDLDIAEYEKWLEARLAELVIEAGKAEKRAARRRKIAAHFLFPFPAARPGQVELIKTVEDGMAHRQRMLIQAPTGLGKTAGVLYPVLREALGRGQKVVYVTPKNSQHSVAEDAVRRFQETGAKVKSLTITAKGKICLKSEPLCDPVYCEYARDYYAKVHSGGILDILARKRTLKARMFRELGEEHEVCPFELQLDGAREADVVICDYNYVFAPRSAFGRMTETGLDQEGRPGLVIDEAHNLPSRAMDYYSPALSTAALESMRAEIRTLPERFRYEGEELLNACIQVVRSSRSGENAGPSRIDPPVAAFLEQDTRLRTFLSKYLDSGCEIRPRDPVMNLCSYWSAFADMLERAGDPEYEQFFTTSHPHPTGGTVKITCCDASEMLKARYDEYEQVVAFSATLKPFAYYAKLSGLDPDAVLTAEFESPFPRENRKILIIPQISTKYSDRELNYPKIAGAIERITSIRRGNYFAFFPSFGFLERVFALVRPHDFVLLRQERDMKLSRTEAMLEQLRDRSSPKILFAVQGGVFSEGVDYPGDMAIGAFVVGPPLPTFDLEREEMRGYYQKRYNAGFDYAYAVPAMSKAVQAAGRVIRSETDRGLIVLMDSRFVQPGFSGAMPGDWFERQADELVSESILKDVAQFWAGNGGI